MSESLEADSISSPHASPRRAAATDRDLYAELARNALAGIAPSEERSLWILDGPDVELLPLLQAAYEPRRQAFGRKVKIHVLNNVQNGLCPEDCGYCSQNKHSKAAIRKYAMKSDEQILAEAEAAAKAGASRYCMVLSGRSPTIERTRRIGNLIREIKSHWPIEVCLSAGLMGDEHAQILSRAGLDRMNHNLNTSERHYPSITESHSYADRVATLQAAKRNGIAACSGLIVGMGEESIDIVDVAFRLREFEVPSIPVNFLIPIEGNQLQHDGSLSPERCLRTLCLMRFINPSAEIRIAGGREGHLRTMQPFSLYPANSLFVEGYLTTRGDARRRDLCDDSRRRLRDRRQRSLCTAQRCRNELVRGRPPIDVPDPGGGEELLKPEIART